ncbi:YjdF family protein [Bacillus wiedmannii]|uniref:YjdF family protein n=1 Tax=Bacillus wiedmannii TaxID=1890302 RepID=UPI00065B77E1|nr:YjdF family protein [Bacillus wiedmannii]KMP74168.1 5-formyltetrahydrofolate cyclo-ligase [Bacillus cereus]MCQ6542875.1 YjdF family protein [Bacillus wiedmannii]MCQ6570601.1 YjdF family protein [Bacillus wiedmannii]MCU5576341.1 YjdF family protein [Bacillus wiedmannii]WMS80962.1 YjdF family protein [Bacillus wiedmannii]
MDLTVYHDGQFFVGIITHKEKGKLYGARYIFGMEPSDEEVLIFVNGPMLAYFQHVAKCGVEVEEKQRPKNIKRIIRQAVKEVNVKRFTKAQEAISLSYELYKQEKKVQSKEKREAEKQRRRLIKVQKAKQKHRGH